MAFPDAWCIYVGELPYSNCGGTFYVTDSGGYKVVAPPAGAMVTWLPQGAVQNVINNTQYYVYNDVYYHPFYSGSYVVYEVVKNPNASTVF